LVEGLEDEFDKLGEDDLMDELAKFDTNKNDSNTNTNTTNTNEDEDLDRMMAEMLS